MIVGKAGEDDDRHRSGALERSLEGSHALRIGEAEIEEDGVEGISAEEFDGVGKPPRRRYLEFAVGRFPKRHLEQRGIGGVVFNEENSQRFFAHTGGGRTAVWFQKRSISLMARLNVSTFIGFTT